MAVFSEAGKLYPETEATLSLAPFFEAILHLLQTYGLKCDQSEESFFPRNASGNDDLINTVIGEPDGAHLQYSYFYPRSSGYDVPCEELRLTSAKLIHLTSRAPLQFSVAIDICGYYQPSTIKIEFDGDPNHLEAIQMAIDPVLKSYKFEPNKGR